VEKSVSGVVGSKDRAQFFEDCRCQKSGVLGFNVKTILGRVPCLILPGLPAKPNKKGGGNEHPSLEIVVEPAKHQFAMAIKPQGDFSQNEKINLRGGNLGPS